MEEEKEDSFAQKLHALEDGQHLFFERTFKTLTYCNVCTSLLWGLTKQGLQCHICRTIVHHNKCQDAKGFLCKPHSCDSAAAQSQHHWVRGNLRVLSSGLPKCAACKSVIAVPVSPIALGKYSRCSICTIKVHDECLPLLEGGCTGGALGDAIVLPNEMAMVEGKLAPRISGKKCPILLFINSRSGSAQGDAVLKAVSSYLNKWQIWDLADGGPKRGLELFRNISCRVIACGGDGTFGWLQSAIDAGNFKIRPFVGHFPLGTGNDMSRSLGWGPGYAGEDIKKVLFKFARAEVAVLDRWKVTFDGKAHGYTPAMNNYFGVGVDAQVAHDFHTAREANPEKFSNRTLNKLKYVTLGVTTSLKGLSKAVSLFCDDVQVAVPENSQALAVLNLPNYAGGQKLWDESESKDFGKQALGDGLLEIVSLRGSADVGLAAVGIKPVRLAQCKRIKFILSKELPVQMDGEPWIQDPCTIEISLLNQVAVLVSSSSPEEIERALELACFENEDQLLEDL